MRKTFEQWMQEVDRAINILSGLSANDLPDVCYRDMHEAGTKPSAAARRAIRNAME